MAGRRRRRQRQHPPGPPRLYAGQSRRGRPVPRNGRGNRRGRAPEKGTGRLPATTRGGPGRAHEQLRKLR